MSKNKAPAGSRANIRRIMQKADDIDISEGRVSYFRYNEVIRGLADHYSTPFPIAAAVFAALSPNVGYVGNLRSAATVLKGFSEGVPVDHVKVATYNHCRDRAYSYLEGVDFLKTTKGPKIRSFYLNILNPMDPAPVTIDGHAVNIWRGRRINLKAVVGNFRYNDIADDYRAIAKELGLIPNQVQAITWFAWKRLHSILAPARQLELFRDVTADFWQTFADAAEIEPYPYFTNPSISTLRKNNYV